MQFNKSSRRRPSSRRRLPKTKKNSRFLELAIVAIFALVLIYAASFAIRIQSGLSKTVDFPEHIVRLQILNGCGTDGAANSVTRALPAMIKLPLDVKIVDVDNFNSYDVEHSFVISRQKDLKPAKILAEQIGLDLDNIVFEPIENNYRSISATLVVGKDFETIFLDRDKKEEK